MVGNKSRKKSGRIYPSERDCDDKAQRIGSGVALPPDYEQQLHATAKFQLKTETKRDYRRRIKKIIQWWENHDSEFTKAMYKEGVRDVSDDDLKNESKSYFGKFKKDLVYTGLEVKGVLYFLMNTQSKTGKSGSSKLKSYEDARKYFDAIKWGASVANQLLPSEFFSLSDQYLASYKKKVVDAKKSGDTDERSANPIPVVLYKLLLKWALEGNNVMVWFWTICQWNFMARSCNIEPLRLDNFSLGADSIIGKYDYTKADQTGERLSEKNIFANPFEWKTCFWTSMGIWIALRGEEKFAENGNIFKSGRSEKKTASNDYCEQVRGILNRHLEEAMLHMDTRKFSAHGFRKGSATNSLNGTTHPPSIISVARRGEWSIGSVLDLYWHFGSIGDHYLGRVIALLNPNEPEFATLPPHWILPEPLNNSDVEEAFCLTFGLIPKHHPHSKGLLLRSLACMVYHHKSLRALARDHPGHDFTKLSLLHNQRLCESLELLVTTEPTPGVMEARHGIPPHVEICILARQCLEGVNTVVTKLGEQTQSILSELQEFMQQKARESGQLTPDMIEKMFKDFETNLLTKVNVKLDEQQSQLIALTKSNASTVSSLTSPCGESKAPPPATTDSTIHYYDGKFHDVPKKFQFPNSPNLREGVRFWFKGLPVSSGSWGSSIKPFRKLTRLPPKLKNKHNLEWKRIFTYLEEHVPQSFLEPLERDPAYILEQSLTAFFEESKKVLQSRLSYCFEGDGNPMKWKIATWSKKSQRSSVERFGTAEDKKLLPPATFRNEARKQGKRFRSLKPNPMYPERQQKRHHHMEARGGTPGTGVPVTVTPTTRRSTRRLRSWRERIDDEEMVKLDMNWEEGELLGFIGNGSGTDATKTVIDLCEMAEEKETIDLCQEKETIDLCQEDDDVVLFLQTRRNERVGDQRVTQSELDEVDVVCNVPLTRDDLRTCVGTNWLNSRVIDCYSIHIQEQSHLKICIVSILVYTDIKNLGARAAARKHLSKKSFHGLDLIMFPMTLGTNQSGGGGHHHVLCVINCLCKSVRIYDSKMGSEQRHDQRANTVLDCLAEKALMDNQSFDKKEWKIEHIGQEDTPQQQNGHDCGVFVCTLAYFLSKGKDMEAEIRSHNCLIANYMALQRPRIIMSLLNPRYPISLPFVD